MTIKLCKELRGAEGPDLIIITGDIASGQYWDPLNYYDWIHMVKPLKECIDETPFAIVPGFHDFEADANQYKIMSLIHQQHGNLNEINEF